MTYKWWETLVFYQIYPRSFADANGDGIGDIQGIISKLDYLQWLGIQGIWLSPHYPSPQIDVGYDIADYTAVEPDYGTMDDFQHMLEEMHQRDMKLILDLVLNHTSDQHHWFQDSKSSRDNPKRDWYIWRDGVDGNPPNNWESTFGGSAWEYDETTDQYYYHFFLKEQPDLNWRNPEVKEAMFNAARFWLDMGVDGFRLDAIGTIYEDIALTPHKSRYDAIDIMRCGWIHDEDHGYDKTFTEMIHDLHGYQHDLPEVFDLMKDFRAVINEYEDRFLVGESSDVRYLGDGNDHLHSIFNFDITMSSVITPNIVRDSHEDWREKIPSGAWQSNTLNNHDQSRVATHFASGENKTAKNIIALSVVLFLEGIPFLYYGEEIGMEDYAIQSLDELRDMVGSVYRQIRAIDGISDDQIVQELGKISRDRCRTPMQWDNRANAGFSPKNTQTWLPVNPNYQYGVNVSTQKQDAASLLNTYRDLIQLRNQNIGLQIGKFRDLEPNNQDALVFLRECEEQTCLVVLNFTAKMLEISHNLQGTVLYSTSKHSSIVDMNALEISPFEVLIVALD